MRLLALAAISTVCVTVSTLVATLTGSLPPANAAVMVYPWCAHYMMKGGAHSCAFITFEQCLANVSGIGGSCQQNPYNTAPAERPRKTRRTRH